MTLALDPNPSVNRGFGKVNKMVLQAAIRHENQPLNLQERVLDQAIEVSLNTNRKIPLATNPSHYVAVNSGDSFIIPAGTRVRENPTDPTTMTLLEGPTGDNPTFHFSGIPVQSSRIYRDGFLIRFDGAIGVAPRGLTVQVTHNHSQLDNSATIQGDSLRAAVTNDLGLPLNLGKILPVTKAA